MGNNNIIRILLLLVLLVSTDVSLPPVQVVESQMIQEIQ
jgi:hypothetical protein